MTAFHKAQIFSPAHFTAFCTACALACAFCFLASVPSAFAGAISLDSSKTTATIAPSVSIEYSASSTSESLWNHGYFYVCFFQGTSSASHTSAKASSSSVSTYKYSVSFNKGVSWAKVHVAAADSSSSSNGGKAKRLKNSSGTNLKYSSYLAKSRKFYVWISDTGGTLGTISLRGTTKRTVYAGASKYSNVNTITVSSQLGADHSTSGKTESGINDIINIPFNWSGKLKHQVPYKELCDKGVSSSGKHTFYRLNWRQYSDGVTNEGYSPYKLQHDSVSASNLWASVNLGSVGITAVPTYKEASTKNKTSKVYRNYNTTLGLCLKRAGEQVALDTNGGTLKKGSASYKGTSVEYSSGHCESTITLPKKGEKTGRDGTSTGYELIGYTWASGTNRSKFSSTTPSSSKQFVPFDQSTPQTLSVSSPVVDICNIWQLPKFSSSNSADGSGTDMLPTMEKATVVFKANWKPKTFYIHYEVDGVEVKTVAVDYDSFYKIDDAPSATHGWSIVKKDGTSASSQGYMPSQDLYVSASTLNSATIKYFINGSNCGTYSIPFGTSPLISSAQKEITFNNDGIWSPNSCSFTATYTENKAVKTFQKSYTMPNNSFGGVISDWYTDTDCTIPAESPLRISSGDSIELYAYTTHRVHFLMDAHTQKSLDDTERQEELFCMHEETCRYGDTFAIPAPEAVDEFVTRTGCEKWSETCGKWFDDLLYQSQSASQKVCTGDISLYSFNTVKLSYDLTDPAKAMDAAEGGSYTLFSDQECTLAGTMRSYLPDDCLIRYGERMAIGGDGVLYRSVGGGAIRTLTSIEGGYLISNGEGDLVDDITLEHSTTIYKDWSQSIFDGVITS